jgi:chromate transporter
VSTVPDGACRVSLGTVVREWTRIGLTGFGGPPAHIVLIRQLVVERRGWLTEHELEDAISATNLLPGPASTQLAIFCAGRVAGPIGAIAGGLGFIVPGVVTILALSVLFLGQSPPNWALGAGAGAGAAVAAVAVNAGRGLIGPSWNRVGTAPGRRLRWLAYALLGGASAALAGPYLVLVLIACGLVELGVRTRVDAAHLHAGVIVAPLLALVTAGGFGALVWVAFKVGALSYGGGFVIIPLMQGDAVHVYHWMTASQFLNAVALGQITPCPVVATVAAVGYAAHGVAGGVLAAVVAFVPSFAFILLGSARFERLRSDTRARAFLDGSGPAAIGAILGAAIPLAGALHETWQFILLGVAAVALLVLRAPAVPTLLGTATVGVVVALAGGPLP